MVEVVVVMLVMGGGTTCHATCDGGTAPRVSCYGQEPKLTVAPALTNSATTNVDFRQNSITELVSSSFDTLNINLLHFFISGNAITSLAATIFDKLINLNSLNVGDNALTELALTVFDKLVNLEYLSLGNGRGKREGYETGKWIPTGNIFTKLNSEWFKKLTNLKDLMLRNVGLV
jgi:Leucine-rich repeat (LRR) protein